MLGVDIARNLVEAGNKRAKEHRLTNCRFQEGDATNLHQFVERRRPMLPLFQARRVPPVTHG